MLACCHLRSSQIESRASRLKLDHHAFEFQSSGILKICLTAPHAGRKSGANLCFLIPQIVFGLTIFLAVATSLHTSPRNEFGVNTNCQEAKGITTSASDNKKKKPCQTVEHPGNLNILGKRQQGKTFTWTEEWIKNRKLSGFTENCLLLKCQRSCFFYKREPLPNSNYWLHSWFYLSQKAGCEADQH